jgi:hypothetical protein
MNLFRAWLTAGISGVAAMLSSDKLQPLQLGEKDLGTLSPEHQRFYTFLQENKKRLKLEVRGRLG